jgi:phosphoribosylaminoimidazole-succinocarboxamide synthase
LMLGDEVLTPESSRFIRKEDFEKWKYLSMDKQILRNWAEENWVKNIPAGQTFEKPIPIEIKDQILNAYLEIFERLYWNQWL